MTILISGASGYVGSTLVNSLSIKHTLYTLHNADVYRREGNTFYLNLLDQTHIKQFCTETIKIDIIVHTASKMASSDNINDISLLYDNLAMFDHLSIIAEHFNPSKLINFSSMAVYPNVDGEYDENSTVKPSMNNDAFYGLSKFCGENIIDFRLRNTPVKIAHLRIGQIYSDDMRDDRLYKMMKKELKEQNQITLFGNGERVSNFIHIDSLVSIVDFFIACQSQKAEGIFNVGDHNYSYKEFAQQIIEESGTEKAKIVLNPAGCKSRFFLNTDKLMKLRMNKC